MTPDDGSCHHICKLCGCKFPHDLCWTSGVKERMEAKDKQLALAVEALEDILNEPNTLACPPIAGRVLKEIDALQKIEEVK